MLDFTNVNTLTASILVETWVRLGADQAVVCPGSRSSPLTIALARHPEMECVVSLDERSGSFWALGQGKRTGKPVILVCTSGTAAANFLPAIIEAHYSQVPLLVLTGDRPPLLRHCQAGQTIDQIKLYGHYPQWQTELALPTPTRAHGHYLRQTALQAWQRCVWPRRGVVHLNCPFAEPLAPVAVGEPLGEWFEETDFFAGLTAKSNFSLTLSGNFPDGLFLKEIQAQRIGLMVVGVIPGGETDRVKKAIQTILTKFSYPVLCDALCSVRNDPVVKERIITGYDWILRSPSWSEMLKPEQVIQIGELPTSKILRDWLAQGDVPRVVFGGNGETLDPLHGRTVSLPGTLEDWAAVLPALTPSPDQLTYTQRWQDYDQVTQDFLQTHLAQTPWSAPVVVSQLPALLPPQTTVMVANSLPVRWLEWFWPANGDRHEIFVNRGANGIDGTLSTALGLAHHNPHLTVLITGDLSLLHDSNGFLNHRQCQGKLTIILLNNQGGGIFETLPIAAHGDVFETYFATPQALDFAQLCQVYAVPHHPITDPLSLKQALHNPPPVQVLEIPGDRPGEAQWLRDLQKTFAQGPIVLH